MLDFTILNFFFLSKVKSPRYFKRKREYSFIIVSKIHRNQKRTEQKRSLRQM